MSELLLAAMQYAERGWPVFPLHGIVNSRCTCGHLDCSSPGKHPLVRSGLHDASTDARLIKEWWRQWRQANIALVTGEPSGIVAIDIDLGHRTNTPFGSPGEEGQDPENQIPRAMESMDRIIHKVPRTLTTLTGGGGLHLLLVRPGDRALHNHTSRLPGIEDDLPGIDLRGNGGYIVAPPSAHVSGERYRWLDADRQPVVAPDWLKEPPRVARPLVVSPPRFTTGEGTPYGLAALQGLLDELRAAETGTRNHTLYRVARRVWELAREGHLSASAIESLFEIATLIGLSGREAQETIVSASRSHQIGSPKILQ
jgi:Bifunctional DNA primase/polymerase, N-terminal